MRHTDEQIQWAKDTAREAQQDDVTLVADWKGILRVLADTVDDLSERAERAENAIREIERMAGSAGSGEVPAMPITRLARAALQDTKEPA